MLKELLYNVSTYSPLLPLVTGIFFFDRLNRSSRLILALLVFAAFAQLFSRYHHEKANVWLVFNLYSAIDALCWSYAFYLNNKLRLVGIIIAVVFTAQAMLFIGVATQSNFRERFFSEFVCLNSLLQLIWVLLFFISYYFGEQHTPLEKHPMAWFSLGLLVYAPSTYFLFAFYDIVRAVQIPEYASLWSVHDFLNTFMYLLFTVAMFVNNMNLQNSQHAIVRP